MFITELYFILTEKYKFKNFLFISHIISVWFVVHGSMWLKKNYSLNITFTLKTSCVSNQLIASATVKMLDTS